MTVVPTKSEVDIFSDDVLLDSQPTHDRLREQAPVVYLPERDLWAITRYEDVRAALADHEAFSSKGVAFNPKMNEILSGTSLASDPPEHGPLRAAITENLTPRAVRGMKGHIDETADAIVRDLVERGEFDAMHELAKALPVAIVINLIGVKEDVHAKMLPWAQAALNMQGPMNERAETSFPLAGELFEWTHNQIQADDLNAGSIGKAVFAAADRGEIPPESPGLIIHQFIAAGMDTTITAISNAIVLLGRHQDQFRKLRADPAAIPAAFAEIQRMAPPIPVLSRLVTKDIEIGGVVIPEGSNAALLLGAANRDPRHYEEPDTFDITRNPTDHLSFGYGIHGCAGQGLAKLEVYAVIQALTTHLRGFTLGEVERKIHNITRPYDLIEVTALERA